MLVSICVAVFNGEKYLSEQIQSIFRSLEYAEISDFEVLVSDDGSTDGCVEFLESIEDPRVSVIMGPGKGVVRNFENLLLRASGDMIFLSDQDDIWVKRKVKVCVDSLRFFDLVVSDAVVVDQDNAIIYNSFFDLRNSGPGVIKNLYRNTYIGCCMCFNRKKLLELNCIPFPKDVPMHDWWIGLRFNRVGAVKFIDEPLVMYRRHGSNVSPTVGKSWHSFRRRLQSRWTLLKNLGLVRFP